MGDAVLDQLRAATADHAHAAADSDAVDGVPARWVAAPADTDQTAAVMKVAATNDLAVVPRGAGTKLTWGNPPSRLDVLLDTGRLDRIVEHAAGDMIVIAEAGCRLDTLQASLRDASQRLALDPSGHGGIGGTIASAATGPSRLSYGAVRDLLIGLTMVRADGVVANSGGKVVKNVAGYDLAKLLTGSYGTLGIITRAVFRLHPLPAASSVVTIPASSPAEVHDLVQKLIHSQLTPAGVELDLPTPDDGTLGVLLEGTPNGVEGRTARTLELLGARATSSATPPPWWGREPFDNGDVALKITHEIGQLPSLLSAIDAASRATHQAVQVRGSVAVGTLLAGVHTDADLDIDAVARLVDALRHDAASYGGSVVVLDAPPAVKARLDVWGPVRGLEMMRSIKHQFDPQRRLAPGRFVGGI
ncbi:MAG: FAD-binding protein [Propionibacteriales bacterium]|nr:FAD-binding protein [Propionibacteriales bacterium]